MSQTAMPKVVDLRMELVGVTKRKLKLRLWRYGFIIVRDGKKPIYHLFIGRRNDKGETEPLGKISFYRKMVKTPNTIAVKIAELGDSFLSANAEDVTEAILSYVNAWKDLLIRKELDDLLSVPLLRGDETWWWDNGGGTGNFFAGGTSSNIEKIIMSSPKFENILSYISKTYS